jgi:jumonji domain-containing protein 7
LGNALSLSCLTLLSLTPPSNADAPTTLLNTNLTVFAKPYEELQSFPSFLTYLQQQSSLPVPLPPSHSEIRYAQTQDNNLPHEYTLLASSVPSSIPFARIALSRLPDATNLWIGNSHSVTALHKDDYENIYVQVLGQKHFVLLPPVASPGVNERTLKGARYRRSEEGGFELALDEDGGDVPFAMWDPDVLDRNATRYSRLLRPIRVTLDPGDFLYLPAMW